LITSFVAAELLYRARAERGQSRAEALREADNSRMRFSLPFPRSENPTDYNKGLAHELQSLATKNDDHRRTGGSTNRLVTDLLMSRVSTVARSLTSS
jgi:hypothetical protein